MKSSVVLMLAILLGWAASQPEPGHPGADDDDPQPPSSGVPRFPRSPYVDPQMGGNRPTTSALVQAVDVHAAIDDVLTLMDNAAAPDQSLDQSALLGPEDDGKISPSKI